MPNQKPTPQQIEAESNRSTGALFGGGLLGASLAGPVGAIIGGFIGYLLADSVNKSKRESSNRPDHQGRDGNR